MLDAEETEILFSCHPQCEGILEKASQSAKRSHLQEGNVFFPNLDTVCTKHYECAYRNIMALCYREVLRVASTLLQAAGHLLITAASMIRRVIEGTELWQPQRAEYTASWN